MFLDLFTDLMASFILGISKIFHSSRVEYFVLSIQFSLYLTVFISYGYAISQILFLPRGNIALATQLKLLSNCYPFQSEIVLTRSD